MNPPLEFTYAKDLNRMASYHSCPAQPRYSRHWRCGAPPLTKLETDISGTAPRIYLYPFTDPILMSIESLFTL